MEEGHEEEQEGSIFGCFSCSVVHAKNGKTVVIMPTVSELCVLVSQNLAIEACRPTGLTLRHYRSP